MRNHCGYQLRQSAVQVRCMQSGDQQRTDLCQRLLSQKSDSYHASAVLSTGWHFQSLARTKE